MAKKEERLTQQRNHLGGHLKNVIVHLDDVSSKIADECEKAWGNRNYSKKDVIRAIRGILGYSSRWVNVPKKQALQFHPLDKYEDKEWWEEKYKLDKYVVDSKDLERIYPSKRELDEFCETMEFELDRIIEFNNSSISKQ